MGEGGEEVGKMNRMLLLLLERGAGEFFSLNLFLPAILFGYIVFFENLVLLHSAIWTILDTKANKIIVVRLVKSLPCLLGSTLVRGMPLST